MTYQGEEEGQDPEDPSDEDFPLLLLVSKRKAEFVILGKPPEGDKLQRDQETVNNAEINQFKPGHAKYA